MMSFFLLFFFFMILTFLAAMMILTFLLFSMMTLDLGTLTTGNHLPMHSGEVLLNGSLSCNNIGTYFNFFIGVYHYAFSSEIVEPHTLLFIVNKILILHVLVIIYNKVP